MFEVAPDGTHRVEVAEWRYVDRKGKERKMPPSPPTNLSAVRIDNDLGPERKRYARAVVHDSAARRALQFIGLRGNWLSLYKAYEVVEEDIGGKKNEARRKIEENGWATRTEQTRFRRTANGYDVIGDEARHGVQTEEPPRNPMTYNEARHFVRSLVRRWLNDVVVPRTGSA